MKKRPLPETGARLEEISTEWAILLDPGRFVARYAQAMRKYLRALIRDPHDAEEVFQDFCLRVAEQQGFVRARPDRGRFRDYLKAALRHSAFNFLRHKQPNQPSDSALWLRLAAAPSAERADQAWLDEWRRCILERVWQVLQRHEEGSRGSLAHTVLRLIIDEPDEDSQALAARTSALVGRPLRPDAFRKQVSRARLLLARALVQEVAQTLDRPTPAQVQEEMIELSLWHYVRDYLPADWLGS